MGTNDGRQRIVAASMSLLTIGAGLWIRSGSVPPTLAKPIGVALWSALVFWLLVLLRPRSSIWIVVVVASCLGVAVEILQRTPFPAWMASQIPASRWVLGRHFHASDLPWYPMGALGAGVLDLAQRRLRTRRPRGA
ncbi:MAG: DUF2809 domain-containing protein [Phycisphaerales bacterium]|nr:DUF2809 domain-containing protein [Phycisphaerales bacterium]